MGEENEIEEYDSCDNCNEYGNVTPCPGAEEEVKNGIYHNLAFCEDCCEFEFRKDPSSCIQEAWDCPRALRLQRETLEKIAQEMKMKKWKAENTYITSEGTMAIGLKPSKPTEIIKDSTKELTEFYMGDEVCLAKNGQKKHLYSKHTYEKALEILKKLGEEEPDFKIFAKSGIILINGYFGWALISGLVDDDWTYSREKEAFVRNAINGYKIFEDDIKKQLVIFNLESDKIDWNKLNPKEFEELCLEILNHNKSFQDCILTGASSDEGRDIKATEKIQTLDSIELRNWCVQCKHYQSRPLNRGDIDNLDNLHKMFKFDVYCLMTSSTFSPSAIRIIEEFKKDCKYRIKLMDKTKLESIIKGDPKLLEKFYEK